MSWRVVPDSGEGFGSDDPTDTLARVWQVENAVGKNAPIEVSVSRHALQAGNPDYLDEVKEATNSAGESEVLRAIKDLPDTRKPPRSVRLLWIGRQTDV
jgi:hypothetical protein